MKQLYAIYDDRRGYVKFLVDDSEKTVVLKYPMTKEEFLLLWRENCLKEFIAQLEVGTKECHSQAWDILSTDNMEEKLTIAKEWLRQFDDYEILVEANTLKNLRVVLRTYKK